MNKEVKPTWNYILNDLALYSLFMRVAYSEDVPKQDKVDLEHQIKLLQQENKKLKDKVNQLETNIEEAIELINNFDVFKEFSFPLMKRDEENQVKSSIDYEFKTTLYKQLLSILERGKE